PSAGPSPRPCGPGVLAFRMLRLTASDRECRTTHRCAKLLSTAALRAWNLFVTLRCLFLYFLRHMLSLSARTVVPCDAHRRARPEPWPPPQASSRGGRCATSSSRLIWFARHGR